MQAGVFETIAKDQRGIMRMIGGHSGDLGEITRDSRVLHEIELVIVKLEVATKGFIPQLQRRVGERISPAWATPAGRRETMSG